MTTDARIGYGTILAFETAPGSNAWTTFAERVEIGGPSFSRDVPDATHMDSPNGWREFIAGLKDGGELAVEAHWLPNNAAQAAARAVFLSGALTNWKLTFPSVPAVDWILPGIAQDFELDIPLDDKMMLSYTIKVSGEPTLA